MKSKPTQPNRLACCLMLLALLGGCRREIDVNEAIAKVNENNIQRLANLYFAFQMKHDWQGPADDAEFKAFLRSYNPQKLTRIGIDPHAIDELFINERDGEPFKIRYSVVGSAMGSSEPVIFESVGVDGKRMVGFLDMVQREVDDAEYEELWAGKMKPAELNRDAIR
ncbi:hypothetical protein [Bythopirellula goksoeyrii]|uniref:Uncharacterized protein n=1 Tax=Bythopirellula goksoeyrii TaxID=1400387 RepID=A0A5B9QAU6_9BACT|nr:hypothetical protein [Bythopirellula goksoeyrii]QEG34889.1 hypothetical protein Pr1d_21770 [Bythopirellula goksoeyrii]